MLQLMTNLSSPDVISIAIYLLLMGGIGLFFKWFVKDIHAYTKGSGAIPWVVAGISNFMALFSTFIFVAYAGIAYEYGLVAVTVLLCTVPPCIIAGLIFAKKWRRLDVSTPIEYLETRFNPAVRQTMGWIGILTSIADNMVRLYAIGIFLTAVTPFSLPFSLILSSLIIITFTLWGGLWAVSIMGTVQFVILVFTSLMLFWLSLDHIGGFTAIKEKIPEHLNLFNGPKGQIFWLTVYYIMIIIKYNSNWIFIQRLYSVKDERSATKVAYLTAALFLIFPIIFMVPPIITRIVMPDIPDKEMAYVLISNMLLPPGLMGIMIASMFAATMSTLNSEYNVISGVLSHDVYKRWINPKASDNELLLIAKLSVIVIGSLTLFGAMFIGDFGGAFEANKLFSGILAIPIGIPLLLGVIDRWANPAGAINTVIFGIIGGIVLNFFPSLIKWELATIIEIFLCISFYYLSTIKRSKDKSYQSRVSMMFKKLNTPVSVVPAINTKFARALGHLYSFSLFTTALLFIGMGMFFINELSGALSVGSGMLCLLLGIILWFFKPIKMKSNV